MTWPNRGMAHRPVIMGTHGAVASAHYLASVAGLRMLQLGGHAVDAAVAIAAALNVAEPYMSGAAGNGYMLVHDARTKTTRALDYIGPAAAAATPGAFEGEADKGHGPKSGLVPTNLVGWLTAHAEYGKLDRATVFGPAIEYAEQGIPISLKNHYFYRAAFGAGHLTDMTKSVFMPEGKPPAPGSIIKQPLLARTYRELAVGGIETFLRGSIAKTMIESLTTQGGLITLDDLAGYLPEWCEPARIDYRGYTIHTPPPPCAGMQYLQTFNILEAFDLAASGQNSARTIHLMAEAMKLAVADRIAYAADPTAPFDVLLGKEYAGERRKLIDDGRAAKSEGESYVGRVEADIVKAGEPKRALKECTTHFDVIDGQGNSVAVTQSLGDGFGSGVMLGETGLMLNNFNFWFDLQPESVNVIGPRKKQLMCMAPSTVTRGGDLFMAIGTPGSWGILETTPQMISNIIDHGFSIQAAIEAPRFRTYENTTIEIEARVPKVVRDELIGLGHMPRVIDDYSYLVGGGHGIMIDPDSGALMGGADPRRDGYALAW